MPLVQWPFELPLPMRAGFAKSRLEARRASRPDAGPKRSRRQWSKVGQSVSMMLDLSVDELARFDLFYNEETKEGSLPFAMAEPGKDGHGLLNEVDFVLTDENDNPVLIASTWLCLFGEQLPSDGVIGVRRRLNFDLAVLPS